MEGRREKVKGPRGTYRGNEESQILREKSQGAGRGPSLLLWKNEEGSRVKKYPQRNVVSRWRREGRGGWGGCTFP